jgi:diguanylate cyclase (GGDEF)-like protein
VVPDSPKPVRDTLLALLFGLLLGGGLAIISEQVLAPLENYRRRQHLDNQSFAYNRQYTERLLELEMMRSRNKSDVFSLGLVRLDGLVDYLDSMPQIMVQRILQQVTSTLKMELKGTDLVGRWAGQATFAIILPSTPFNAANSLMDRIRQKLSEPMKVGESDELISLNPYVGVARSKENETIDAFVARTQKDLDENMFTVPSQTASPTNIKSVKPEING